jgi:hypothetical protein
MMRRALPCLLLALLLAACSRASEGESTTASRQVSEAATVVATSEPVATAAAALQGETRSFRAWEAACDNIRTCTLLGFPSAVEDGSFPTEANWGFLRIERAAGPEAAPAVTVAAGPGDSEPAAQAPMTIAVDGGTPIRVQAKSEDGPYHLGRLEGADAARLIAAVRNGRTLSVAVQNFPAATVSLDGAAAAMLWADERQGRVDTVTALARPGAKPASAVPAAPALPVIQAAKPVGGEVAASPALLKRKEVADCVAEMPEGLSADLTGTRLTAELVLWEVPCGGGAYNLTTAFYLGDAAGGLLRPVSLDGAGMERDGPGHQGINAGFDAATGRIGAFTKARGVGDCGSEDEWVWDGRGFVRASQRLMGRCEGVMVDDWPVLHRAEVR